MSEAKRKLKTCAEIFSGFSFRALPDNDENGDITLVQPKDIDAGISRIVYNNALKINDFYGDSRHFLRSGDVLVSSKGKTTPVVLFEDVNKKVIGSSAFILVRPFPGELSSEYLAWYLRLPIAQKYFQANKAGVTVLNLTVKAVQEFEICLPVLSTQKKMGKLHHSLLEQNAKQLELMEKERKLLDHLMFAQLKNKR